MRTGNYFYKKTIVKQGTRPPFLGGTVGKIILAALILAILLVLAKHPELGDALKGLIKWAD